MQDRQLGHRVLSVQLNSIGSDSWQLAPGAEARFVVQGSGPGCGAERPCPPGQQTRLSLRLAAAEQTLWHWDGPFWADRSFPERRSDPLQYRAALAIPPGTPAGSYPLRGLVYEAVSTPTGGREMLRAADEIQLGVVEVVRSR
jgi:hypothetical protein